MVANNSVIVGLLQKTYLTSALFQKNITKSQKLSKHADRKLNLAD